MKSPFYRHTGPIALSDICAALSIEIPQGANPTDPIQNAESLTKAIDGDITFFFNTTYKDDLSSTQASFCLIEEQYVEYLPESTIALVVSKPYRAWGTVLKLLYQEKTMEPGISPFAKIHPSAQIGRDVSIGAFVSVGSSARIGDHTKIHDHVSIYPGVVIGDDCEIHAHASLMHCTIGDHVLIKPGARIGQSGFGFAIDEQGHLDIHQLGMVRIGNNTHIGANTCIDRGSQNDTIIGNNVRIDNLVQIAHNVEIGDHCVLVAQMGIAGSTKLGNSVISGGQVGIAGHLEIGNRVQIAAQSGIMKSIPNGEIVGGSPAVTIREWHEQTLTIRRLTREHRDNLKNKKQE